MAYAVGQLIGALIAIAILLIPLWKIFGKTGRSPWLSLLIFIPAIGPVICVLILAFGRWPALDGGGR